MTTLRDLLEDLADEDLNEGATLYLNGPGVTGTWRCDLLLEEMERVTDPALDRDAVVSMNEHDHTVVIHLLDLRGHPPLFTGRYSDDEGAADPLGLGANARIEAVDPDD